MQTKRRMDMHDIYAAAEQLHFKDRVHDDHRIGL